MVWVLFLINVFVIFMFIGLGYLIKYRQAYMLIAGYNTASDEEKKEMEAKGMGPFFANWMFALGGWMLLGTTLIVIKIPYAIEGTYGGLILGTVVMAVQSINYSPERTRKLNWMVVIGMIAITVMLVGYGVYSTISTNSLAIDDQKLKVTGEYGKEWRLAHIEAYYLTDQLPKIKSRSFGTSTNNRKKGRFVVEEWGKGWLYLYKDRPPYLVIKSKDSFIMINAKDPDVTQQWFDALTEAKETTTYH